MGAPTNPSQPFLYRVKHLPRLQQQAGPFSVDFVCLYVYRVCTRVPASSSDQAWLLFHGLIFPVGFNEQVVNTACVQYVLLILQLLFPEIWLDILTS